LFSVPRPPSRDSNSSRSTSRSSYRTSTPRSARRSSSQAPKIVEIENSTTEEVRGEKLEEEGEEPNEERESIVTEIEKLKSEKQLLLDQIHKCLEDEHAEKLKDIEDQKFLLSRFNDKLALNETKISQQQSELDQLRDDLMKEREQFLQKKIEQENADKDETKVFKFTGFSRLTRGFWY